MTEAGWSVCAECGMGCNAGEYHPYAACLMFKQCRNSETVRANLQDVRDDSYQQGRAVACEWTYDDIDDYYETACKNAYCLADGTLKDNEHKYCPYCGRLIQLAQQAQEGK